MFDLSPAEAEALAFFVKCALAGSILGLATAFSELRVFSVLRPMRRSLEPIAARAAIGSALLFTLLFASWSFVSFTPLPNIQGPSSISLIITLGLFFYPFLGLVLAVPVAMFLTASLCLVLRRKHIVGPPPGTGAA